MKKYTLCMTAMLALLPAFVLMLAGCDTGTSSGGNTNSTVSVTGVSVDKTSGELYMKPTTTLTATVVPANATNKAVTWSTSDPAIATVAGGVVTPVAAGQATITVTTADGGKTAVCALTVCNPIDISDAAGLAAIDDSPANMSKSYKLTADITGVTTPIGLVSGNMLVPFTGDFDGNGKTVTLNITDGLTFDYSEQSQLKAAGFFTAVVGGSVYDLTVTGTINVSEGTNGLIAGGVAGAAASATISGVSSSVNVTAAGTGTGNVLAGGIAGVVYDGTIRNVHSSGTIAGSSTNTGSDINVDVGGIVGVISSGSLDSLSSTGSVSAASKGKNAQAGGIVGVIEGNSTVRNVYSTGTITGTGTNTARAKAGGIVAGGDVGSLSYAYATGSVTATADDSDRRTGAGGIMAGNSNSEGFFSVSHTVALNSAVGVSGGSTKKDAHRVVGYTDGTLANNYGKADLTPTGGGSSAEKTLTGRDGEDVTVAGGPLPTAYTAPNQAWWTGTGFSGADWTTVWEWDAATGLPKLR